jgi:hypothetical protein
VVQGTVAWGKGVVGTAWAWRGTSDPRDLDHRQQEEQHNLIAASSSRVVESRKEDAGGRIKAALGGQLSELLLAFAVAAVAVAAYRERQVRNVCTVCQNNHCVMLIYILI